MKQDSKCIVIGLDGATFELINPLIKKGKLPTIRKLMEEGVHGVLKSTIPPLTGPAWVSFATGKNPGKHGCYDFELPRNSLDQIEMISSRDIKGDTFYEVLDREGKRCILINLPCSYPPRTSGVVITDFLTRGKGFVFPQSLMQEIPEFKEYRVVPNRHPNLKKYISDIRSLEKVRFECARKLFQRDWDFFFILFQGTDWVQHRTYDRMLAQREPDAIGVYQDIDGYIRWFVDNAGRVPILIMSDHGFHAYRKAFAINKWLMEEGYLKIKQRQDKGSTIRESQRGLKIPVAVVAHRWLFKIGARFYRPLRGILPRTTPVIRVVPDPGSTAYSILSSANGGCAGIYINSRKRFDNGSVEVGDYNRVRSEIMAKLAKLTDKSGTLVFSSVLRREDVYSGEDLDKAPDIFIFSEEYDVSPFGGANEDAVSNEHSPYGIFIAYGEDTKKGMEIGEAQIIDLAPTILHLMKVGIPADTDGRVLTEILEEDSQKGKCSIEY